MRIYANTDWGYPELDQYIGTDLWICVRFVSDNIPWDWHYINILSRDGDTITFHDVDYSLFYGETDPAKKLSYLQYYITNIDKELNYIYKDTLWYMDFYEDDILSTDDILSIADDLKTWYLDN